MFGTTMILMHALIEFKTSTYSKSTTACS